MEKDINQLKVELIQSVIDTDDRAMLQAALRVLQLDRSQAPPKAEKPLSDKRPDTSPHILPGGAPPTGDAKGLQDDIDEVFNPK